MTDFLQVSIHSSNLASVMGFVEPILLIVAVIPSTFKNDLGECTGSAPQPISTVFSAPPLAVRDSIQLAYLHPEFGVSFLWPGVR